MIPIALFTYNRSQNLQRTLDCLKDNKIDILYIFSDGPKNEDDIHKIGEVRNILDKIDWVKTEKFYQEKNIGLSESIISGVNKVFEKYDAIICVEDDICVENNFYEYMKACLEKYKDEPKIAGVTGLRYPFSRENIKNYPYDVFFTSRFSSWGWGTWRRFWQTVDFNQESITKKIKSVKFDTRPSGFDMENMIKGLTSGSLHGGWDVYCGVNMLLNKQYFVWPTWNMVENVGFTEGTHASAESPLWRLRWECERSPYTNRLHYPETEEGQEKIREDFLAFFKGNQITKPEWKNIPVFVMDRVKSFIIKSFNSFGFEITRNRSIETENTISYSHLDEQRIINEYLSKLNPLNKYCVDIAASDGISQSNTFALFNTGWLGLAVECDSEKFSKLASTYQKFTGVNLSKNKITPENIIDLLNANSVPFDFGFLNLDIDSYDYFVLEKILELFRPSLLCIEINEKIPPPLKFTVKWDPNFVWSADHFYGQSLSHLYELTSKVDYELVELHYNNAIFIPKEMNFTRSLTPEEAYREGYLNKPDRNEKFPWNYDMEDVLHLLPNEALEFINRYFTKYKEKFILTL